MKEELLQRHKKTQLLMQQENIKGFLILQMVDLYYYANSIQLLAAYLPDEGDIICFYKRSFDKVKQDCPLNLIQIDSLKQIPSFIDKNPDTLGIEMDVVPVKIFESLKKIFSKSIIVDSSKIVRTMRMVKSDFEISIYKEAGKLVDKVFNKIPDFFINGISEIDLSISIEMEFRKNFHLGPVRLRGFNYETYNGHVLSGINGLIPSAHEMTLCGKGLHPSFCIGGSLKKINSLEPVIIDYGFNYKGYHSDIARTFILGKLPEKYNYHQKVLSEINDYLLANLKASITPEKIYIDVLNIVAKNKLEDYFMGYKEKVPFIGHGIGLEVDEYPPIAKNIHEQLVENMILAIEPKFFIPDFGVIGFENNYIITKTGCIESTSFSTNVCEIF